MSERLYNGIELPEEWPPKNIDPCSTAPMAVPYLKSSPAVIPIDIGRQLFVDDFLVETSELKRVFHMPLKYTGNPILKPDTELEINAPNCAAAVPKSGGVWWDPSEKIFKMWYEAGWLHGICYATSSNGLNWERPSLNINPGTNQILPMELGANSMTVVPDWNAKDPLQRYTMRFQPTNRHFPNDTGLCMTSPDGIHWINQTATSPGGDRSTHFYNPFRRKWVQSIRSYFRGRSRDYRESGDFLAGAKWDVGEPVAWVAADRDDLPDSEIGDTPQLYNIDAVAYESLMLGIFEIHRGPANEICLKTGLPKITELNFAYSRDGFHWHRPDRCAQLPAGRHDVWDRGYVQSVGGICTVRGDKLWFYYSGFQGNTNKLIKDEKINGMYDRGATGVAFLRRDGFTSMDAGADSASLTTRPATFSGKHLFVNADIPQGQLRVAVLDERGTPIAPFTMEDSIPFTGDSTLKIMKWKRSSDLSELRGKPVRFRFKLNSGSLYSFWISQDESGRSDGYVAAGGPGFTGMIDTVGSSAMAAEQKLLVRV